MLPTEKCKKCGVEKLVTKFGFRKSRKKDDMGCVRSKICLECATKRLAENRTQRALVGPVIPLAHILDEHKDQIIGELASHSISKVAAMHKCSRNTMSAWAAKNNIDHHCVGGRPRTHPVLLQTEISHVVPLFITDALSPSVKSEFAKLKAEHEFEDTTDDVEHEPDADVQDSIPGSLEYLDQYKERVTEMLHHRCLQVVAQEFDCSVETLKTWILKNGIKL
jgi:hypothetical protein